MPAIGRLAEAALDIGMDETGSAFVQPDWWTTAWCDEIDHVDLARDDTAKTIHVTVYEGPTPPRFGDDCSPLVASIFVELGVLPAGTWTITAEGYPVSQSFTMREDFTPTRYPG